LSVRETHVTTIVVMLSALSPKISSPRTRVVSMSSLHAAFTCAVDVGGGCAKTCSRHSW